MIYKNNYLTIKKSAFVRLSKQKSLVRLALLEIKFDLSIFPNRKDTYSFMSCALCIRVFLLFLVQTVKYNRGCISCNMYPLFFQNTP